MNCSLGSLHDFVIRNQHCGEPQNSSYSFGMVRNRLARTHARSGSKRTLNAKMSDRFFPNASTAGVQLVPDQTASILSFASTALKVRKRYSKAVPYLQRSCSSVLPPLQEIKQQASQHKDISGASIYVGSGGVALTYLHLARQVSTLCISTVLHAQKEQGHHPLKSFLPSWVFVRQKDLCVHLIKCMARLGVGCVQSCAQAQKHMLDLLLHAMFLLRLDLCN
jgi:hypothetical protein